MKALVIGGVTIDYVWLSEVRERDYEMLNSLPFGQKIDFGKRIRSIGGGAANVATALQRLGVEVNLVARVGDDDNGKMVFNAMREEGIDTSLVQVDCNNDTGEAVIAQVANKNPLILARRAANNYLSLNSIPSHTLTDFDVVYLTGLVGDAVQQVPNFISKIKKINNGASICMNPGSSQLAACNIQKTLERLDMTDLIIVNRSEAKAVGQELLGTENLTTIASYLMEEGLQYFCITKDKDGATLYSSTQIIDCNPVVAKIVNTLGAGDAFGSTLAYRLFMSKCKTGVLVGSAQNAASVLECYDSRSGLLRLSQI